VRSGLAPRQDLRREIPELISTSGQNPAAFSS
jgi:hypothetical protein